MRISDWRLSCVLPGLCLVVALAAPRPASAAPNFSPSGPQKVLFVAVDLGSTIDELCPFILGCPLGILKNASLYQPPRHTAKEWEALLNQYGPQFWGLASYGQTQVEFKALVNPSRPDGWWTAPRSAQRYYDDGHLWLRLQDLRRGSDPARFAIDTLCSGLSNLFFCTQELPQYSRLVVMSNFKAQGGVSAGPFSLATFSLGTLKFTMTLVNESLGTSTVPADSMVLATVMHEFGHQLGIPSHYGNCAAYNDVPVPRELRGFHAPVRSPRAARVPGVPAVLGHHGRALGLDPADRLLAPEPRVDRPEDDDLVPAVDRARVQRAPP